MQVLCNGKDYHTSLYLLLNGTDETDCEDFWCLSSALTRCNGFWDCIDGRDELNCSLDILPPNARATKLVHSLNACDATEHFCLHISNRSQDLSRHCISASYAGDGHVDCYGATDERHNICHYRSLVSGTFRVYRCSEESNTCVRVIDVCDGHLDCPLEEDEKMCPWLPARLSSTRFYCHNGTSLSRRIVQCDSIIHCPYGEDEWLCDLQTHSPVLTNFQIIKIPTYPPSLQTITAEVTVDRQTRVLVTSDKKSNWYCNRGIPITHSGSRRCLCSSSYSGERCEYQRERISFILRIVSSPLLQRDMAIKCMIYLIDITTFSILAEEEILHFPYVHSSYKHIVSLPSVRAKNPFIRIDVYEVSTQQIIAYRASWKFHLPFQFLPVRRSALKLDLSNNENVVHRRGSNCHECFHGQCLSYQNSNDVFCYCYNGSTGLHCNHSLLCAPEALSLSSGRCSCPMSRHGRRCFVPYKPTCHCENGATCIPLNARTGQSACLCLDNYFEPYCE